MNTLVGGLDKDGANCRGVENKSSYSSLRWYNKIPLPFFHMHGAPTTVVEIRRVHGTEIDNILFNFLGQMSARVTFTSAAYKGGLKRRRRVYVFKFIVCL